jgi:copper resistance protein B
MNCSRSALGLQPEIEMNLYGNADPARDIAAGLSDLEVGLRLRYEVRRNAEAVCGRSMGKALRRGWRFFKGGRG